MKTFFIKYQKHIISSLTALLILYGTVYAFKFANRSRMINSDILYIEALYTDIFVNKIPVDGWQVVRAPAFLPDWPLYFAARAIMGEYLRAHGLYMIFILVIYALLFVWLLRTLENSLGSFNYYIAFLGITALMAFPQTYIPYHVNNTDLPLFDPTNHQSPFLWGIILIVFWLKIVQGKSINFLSYLFIFIVSTIATASDLWFIIKITAPLTISIFLYSYLTKTNLNKSIKLLIAVYFGSLIGYLVPMYLSYIKVFLLPHVPVGEPFEGVWPFIKNFFLQLDVILSAFRRLFQSNLVYGGIIFFVSYLVFKNIKNFLSARYLKQEKDPKSQSWLAFNIFIASHFIFVTCLIAVNRMWVGPGNLRYYIGFTMLCIFYFGIFFVRYLIKKSLIQKSYKWLFGSICGYLFIAYLPVPLEFPSSPEKAELICFDKTVREYNLKNGLAEYWQAKYFMWMSETKTTVNQSTYHYEPLYWINNYRWYLKPGTNELLEYDFFLSKTNDETFTRFPKDFGEPFKRVNCDGVHVLIFNEEQKKKFNDHIRPKFREFVDKLQTPHNRSFLSYLIKPE